MFQGPAGQIVISFAGTEFDNTVGFLNDCLHGNLPTSIGDPSDQANEAALLYEQVKAQYPDADISFTGHSLGGGLAGLMAVWFNRKATVFDPAPFEAAALDGGSPLVPNGSTMSATAAYLALHGYDDPQFLGYTSAQFAARQNQVTGYAVDGEFLQVFDSAAIESSRERVFPGEDGSLTGASAPFEKHSIDLLIAGLLVPQFETVAGEVAPLLPALFDKTLYAADQLSLRKNLLNLLIDGEVGSTDPTTGAQLAAPTGLLTKFTADMAQLASESGMTAQAPLQKGLVVAAMEDYYYSATPGNFFTTSGNGVSFDFGSIQGGGLQASKSLPFLESGLQLCLSKDEWAEIAREVPNAQAWDVQTGGTAACMSATAGSSSEVMVGGAGADSLVAGSGNETLLGGAGADTYCFAGPLGTDIVLDSDGQGSITLDGNSLSLATADGDAEWRSDGAGGGQIDYTLTDDPLSDNGKSLVITRTGTAGTLIVDDFDLAAAESASGYLGIHLENSAQATMGAATRASCCSSYRA